MSLVVLAVAAVSCGGSPKPTTPPPQLPPETAATAATPPATPDKPAEPPAPTPPEKPAEPEPPPGPVDVTVPAPELQVKLVSPGKGHRAKLAYTAKAGDKQAIEIVLDIAEHQGAPPELGGDQDNAVPSIVLTGDAAVKAVDPKGKADYVITVTGTDVRDTGGKLPAAGLEELKGALAGLQGMTISGSVGPDGTASDVKLHIDSAKAGTDKLVEPLLQIGLPMWPRLPTAAIGVGAKWQVAHTAKVLGKVDVTYTAEFSLAARTAKSATLTETITVSGADQALGDAKLSKIGGSGDGQVTLVPGQLFGELAQHVETKFDALVSGPDQNGQTKSGTLSIDLKQARAIHLK